MSNDPAKPFSNVTEYEVFLYNFCERCENYKENERGFPEFPENGGCPVLDAMENARFDISKFPSEDIRELHNAKTGEKIAWHYCRRFNNTDFDNVMFPYFSMMSRALFPDWDEKYIEGQRCGTCRYFIGGGDYNLCCDLRGGLFYADTKACKNYQFSSETVRRQLEQASAIAEYVKKNRKKPEGE